MTYSTELVELIEEFKEIDDKMERLEMVFDLADEVNLLPIEQWTDSTRVHGCQSEAHVKVEIIDSNVHFYSGADSKLVQGLMGILTMAIHGIEVESVLTLSPEFAAEMGILNSLSPSRSNGFRNMFDKVMNEIRHHA
ncbi:MAG TPA: SufE family protein [Candidatus Poseidoniaceae archaeon]|nr:MAG TPA: SufE family protein [Candidatus Poseidoniales archaeon]DAC59687.1 MAG TPA: SufE family protein [Candidatus Poseidoniales archaeon]HII23604.1 SufE family protein [Candidatus Poseidoniaceae archaeon]HII50402.1 SufE family protein [Candidatus Poseidoniaceae archaeon]|tara:strand:- start:869 stop:1279 length:411 start_codon:yes stop_codon:yes gene_type:complete